MNIQYQEIAWKRKLSCTASAKPFTAKKTVNGVVCSHLYLEGLQKTGKHNLHSLDVVLDVFRQIDAEDHPVHLVSIVLQELSHLIIRLILIE